MKIKNILNNKRIKTILRVALVAAGTAFLVGLTTLGSHKTLEVSAAGQSGMKITLYEWEKRSNLYKWDGMPLNPYAFIMWEDGSNHYFMSGGNVGDNNYRGTNINVDPYIEFSKEYDPYGVDVPKFMTRSLHSVPQLIYQTEGKKADGYGNYYDVWYKMKFSTGKYLYTSYWDHLSAENSGDTWMLYDSYAMQVYGNRNSSYYGGNDDWILKTKPFWFEYDRPAAYDTQIDHSGDKVYGRSSSGGWKCGDFWIWTGKEKTADAIGDYTIGTDQVLTINGDTFLLDGKKLKIEKDGVLCVRGNFYCNGTIDCEGTIVVEKGANMLPFSPTKVGGDVYLHNGGSFIVMSGGKALVGLPAGVLNSQGSAVFKTADATIYNYGILVSGFTEFGVNTTVENHDGAAIYFGYSVSRNPSKLLAGNPSKSAGELGLTSKGQFTNYKDNVTFKSYKGSKYAVGSNVARYSITYVEVDESGNETKSKRIL